MPAVRRDLLLIVLEHFHFHCVEEDMGHQPDGVFMASILLCCTGYAERQNN